MNSMSGHSGFRGAAGSANNSRATGRDIIPKGYSVGQLQQFDPNQNKQYQSLFSQVGPESYLSRLAGGDESLFQDIEKPAWRDFQEAQGQLGSRFSQLAPGSMGAQRGSGFQNAAGQQASDFAMQLQANRQGLQRQGLRDLFELSQLLLGQKPTDRFLVEKPQKQESSSLGGWGGVLGAGLGGLGGFLSGGPGGAFAGANIGSKAFSGF